MPDDSWKKDPFAQSEQLYYPKPMSEEERKRFDRAVEAISHEFAPQKRALIEASKVTAEDLAIRIVSRDFE